MTRTLAEKQKLEEEKLNLEKTMRAKEEEKIAAEKELREKLENEMEKNIGKKKQIIKSL